MLVIKCAKCKANLFQYMKVGKGQVLRCYKPRIGKLYDIKVIDDTWTCSCGNVIGKDTPGHVHMFKGTFITSGARR